jgi:dihydroorotase
VKEVNMKLHIKNGRVIDPAQNIDAVLDVFIDDGKIIALGKKPEHFSAADNEIQTFDATGLVVAPGLVDLSARLREPGNEFKATLESELKAAMHGGVTSLVCPPDTDPVLDEAGLVEMLKQRAKQQKKAHVYPLGALTLGLKGEILTEMAALSAAGCVGFSQAEVALADTNIMQRAMQYAATFNYTVWVRPQDAYIGKNGVAHSGALASRLGLAGIPVMAETIALYTLFELMRATGAKVHLCRISSAAGLDLVRSAKKEGLPLTCDVGAHHVHLTDMDIGFFDSNARLTPPLRSSRDREAILAALKDGTIDAICSDHTPVDDDEKALPFAEASAGATGLELLLSLVLKWVEDSDGEVSLSQALAKVTHHPAMVADLHCGQLSAGKVADICIFDPSTRWTVDAKSLLSQGKHTPFLGYELPGLVKTTIVAGRIAYHVT